MDAAILRRQIRSKSFSRPRDQTLGVNLLDLGGINLYLAVLKAMGEPTQEFESFIPSLLHQQLSDLMVALENEENEVIREILEDLLFETRQKLWPLKN
jgi:hypothetical protein